MPKNNFLLVDLNESKTKKLAETITSDTSRKILNYLAEKEQDTEANAAKELNIPISTVHYHLQKLQEAKLVIVEEYHYSQKGREVNHYKLANKYIIIAPKKVSGLKQALKNVLPVGIIALGISAVLKIVQMFSGNVQSVNEKAILAEEVGKEVMVTTQQAAVEAAPKMADFAQETAAQTVGTSIQQGVQQPDIAFWFLIGSLSAMLIYVILMWVKEKMKR